jgi:ubiquinone/menaquinone biosynthesis C-methylase UbiE
MPDDALPDYEPLLASYHRAFAAELKSMIGTLPLREGDRILEVACGDGAYTPWLARRAGTSGSVVALDLLTDYLHKARGDLAKPGDAGRADFVAASIERLPFAEGSFDLSWCAQSLFSLPEPLEAVRRMTHVVRRGGVVAVLEDDTLHQVLLPWPVDLELAVRSAQWEAFRDESDHPRKFYVGRRLVKVFREAGLVDVQIRTHAANRVAPLGNPEREFLGEHLKDLRERVARRLAKSMRQDFDRLTDPGSPDYLPDQPDLAMTLIDHVVWGRKPG